MRDPFFKGAGGVLSADIAVPEHSTELDFYSTILTTGDAPLWKQDLLNNLESPVIGLGQQSPEYAELPLQWMPHFQVDDVSVSASRAVELGGKSILQSFEGDSQNHWAVLYDLEGAAFGLITAVKDDQPDENLQQRQGKIAWLSLSVKDVSESQKFYEQVIGWEGESSGPENNQVIFGMKTNPNRSAAEIVQSKDESEKTPPVWLIHLPVGDLSKSIQLVDQKGGKVLFENREEGFAVIRDPVGVAVAISKE